ncbi:fungal-specific transcription factor domain-containing protein [Annulohypoxylon bovei var. microspora]|nr:fungal-specific transcription factor domain-containing protein [Annulohypoxylon bovei var. microspora]
MSRNEQLAPISNLARQCLISFEQCLQGTSGLDSQRRSTIEDQMARFSIWTSNMAVFASGKVCMDHRVREAPEVQRLVLGILEILQGRLEECIRLVESLTDPHCLIEIRFSVLAQGDFERIADSISSEVGLLHELSNTIRKASRESQDVKAITSFQIKDDEGNNVEDILKEYFAKNIRDCFPESSDSIRNRLATTMILRRKKILYRRSRYAVNPIKPTQPALKPKIETQIAVLQQDTRLHDSPSQAIKSAAVPSRICSAVQSATTLAPQNFQRASAPSVVSHVKSVDLGSHEELIFPPRPEDPNHGMIELTCPYCLYVLSGLEVSNEARWRKHVLGDLDALICLFDPCDEPNVLYRHSKDWLQHMRKHTKQWRCSAKVHDIQDFNSRGEFEIHLRESHKKNYTSAQLDLLAERAMRSSGPLFDICPLCGGEGDADDDQISGNLVDHIVGHLRSLALKSLPPHYSNNDNASYNSHDDGSARSRSTMKSLLGGSNTSIHSWFSSSPSPPSPNSTLPYNWDSSADTYAEGAIDWRYVLDVVRKPQENEQDFIKEHMARARPDFVPVEEKPLTLHGMYYNNENYDYDSDTDMGVEGSGNDYLEPTEQCFRNHVLRLSPSLMANSYLVNRMSYHMTNCLKRLGDVRKQHLSRNRSTYSPDGAGDSNNKGLELFNGDIKRFRQLKGNTNCRVLPIGFLMPQTADFPTSFECQLCFHSYKFQSLSDWIIHVYEDIQPFTCTHDHCPDPRTFQRKGDWIRHENESHHLFEWWTCNMLACNFTCFNRDDFDQHLRDVHGFTTQPLENTAILKNTFECHKTTQDPPETCPFCDRRFLTWNKRFNHVAKHLELISLPILGIIERVPDSIWEHGANLPVPVPRKPSNFRSLSIVTNPEFQTQSSDIADFYETQNAGRSPGGLNDPRISDESPYFNRVQFHGVSCTGNYQSYTGSESFNHRGHLLLRQGSPENITPEDAKKYYLLNLFFDTILPTIFPILQLSWHNPSISDLIRPTVDSNESYFYCCLMIAAHHYNNTRNLLLRHDITKYHGETIVRLRASLDNEENYRQVLETNLGLILYHCHVGSYDTQSTLNIHWQSYFQGAASVAVLLKLPSLNPGYSADISSTWNRFYSSVMAWVDILGATMKGSAPSFAPIYREMHSSGNNANLGLYELMGCDDRVMHLISEIACLDSLNKNGFDEANLREHISALDGELVLVEKHETNLKMATNFDGSLDVVQLTKNVTKAFLWAARIYLYSLAPDFLPSQPSCVELVEKITVIFQHIPSGPTGYDRCLVWPYLISGSVCTASSGLRQLINSRIENLGDAARLGNFSGLIPVLREGWRRVDSYPGLPAYAPYTPWREIMEEMGWEYLLI